MDLTWAWGGVLVVMLIALLLAVDVEVPRIEKEPPEDQGL